MSASVPPRRSDPTGGLRRKSSPLNRRKREPRHLLRQAIRSSGGLLRALLRIGVVCAVLAGAVLGVKVAHAKLVRSERFEMRRIEVLGLRRLKQGDVLHAAGIRRGQNVFSLDTDRARDGLLRIPWIRTAKVERRLPDRVRIEIEERVAVAILSAGHPYLVDERGEVFKRLGDGDPEGLPTVGGISRDRFRSHRARATEELLEGLSLARAYEEAGLAATVRIAEVRRDPDGGWTLALEDGGPLVRMGKPPFRQRLRRLRIVSQELRAKRETAEYILLDNRVRPDRATVKLRPRPPRPPSAAIQDPPGRPVRPSKRAPQDAVSDAPPDVPDDAVAVELDARP